MVVTFRSFILTRLKMGEIPGHIARPPVLHSSHGPFPVLAKLHHILSPLGVFLTEPGACIRRVY